MPCQQMIYLVRQPSQQYMQFDNRAKVEVKVDGEAARISDDLTNMQYTYVLNTTRSVKKHTIVRVSAERRIATSSVRRRRETAKPAAEATKLDRRRFTIAVSYR